MNPTRIIPCIALATFVFAFGAKADETDLTPPQSALVGDLHAGAGLAVLSSSEITGGMGGGLTGRIGAAVGFQLTPLIAPVIVADFGALVPEAGDPTPFLISAGPGVKLGWSAFDLTLGAVFKVVTSTTPTLLGGGVQARAAYLFGHHRVGPFLQVEDDLLRSGYNLFSATLGVQVAFQ